MGCVEVEGCQEGVAVGGEGPAGEGEVVVVGDLVGGGHCEVGEW